MISISRNFEFAAAHRLYTSVAQDHPCNCLHGHNYKGTVEIIGRSSLVVPEMLIDFSVMKSIIKFISDQYYDHCSLFNQQDRLPDILKANGLKRIVILPVDPTVEFMCYAWAYQFTVMLFQHILDHHSTASQPFHKIGELAGINVSLYETENSKAEYTLFFPGIVYQGMEGLEQFFKNTNELILDKIQVIA
jgi:6-pyruvoyl tetrahydropterin synthase/QueD family protein